MSKLKIAHFADIHILNVFERLKEQHSQFQKVYDELKVHQPDIIFIVGDFLDKFLMNNEAKSIASEFLREISKYTKQVILTLGNHETNQKNSLRISSIESLIKIINCEKIKFLNTTDFYELSEFPGLVLTNWKWGDYINPYIELQDKYKTLQDKFIIDLYHNPINGSKNTFGKEFNDSHYLSIEDFKGDLLLLGDIHQRQFFQKNGKLFGAYSSSLFQLNFGESIDKHGFLVWDINTKSKEFTYQEVDIDSDYLYQNVYINVGFDYENIDLELPIVKPHMRVKINWFDYSSNINPKNQREIIRYLQAKYPQIKEIKTAKNRIDQHDAAKANDNHLQRINQKSVQREILIDYLKNVIQCTDETLLKEVLDLEDDIDSKLERSATTEDLYTWELESFYLDNFRSHGDRWELQWRDLDGLWKIDGLNEQGKTNLWSAICYLLYGQTIETKKTKKFGDNRFINNKRDLDFCECGGVLIINEERFRIVRRTERKWNRNHTELTSCPTSFSILKIDAENNILDNQNEFEKSKNLKAFEECIGDFDDFLRLSVITADTLNSLLSLNESEFIDSILKDAGLDIFERKLDLYKDLKKKTFKREERLILDVLKSEEDILDYRTKISDIEQEISSLGVELQDKESRIKKGIDFKEDEIKKLHKIDEKIKTLDILSINNQVNSLAADKQKKYEEIDILGQKISALPETFDTESYNELKASKEQYQTDVVNANQEIKSIESNVESQLNVIAKINGEVFVFNREITTINNQIQNELDFIDKQLVLKDNEVLMLEKSKVCPSCKQELKPGSSALDSILEKIKTLRVESLALTADKENSQKIKNLRAEIINIESKIGDKKDSIKPIEAHISTLKESIPQIMTNIDILRLNIDGLNEKLKTFDLILKDIELRNKLQAEKNNIPLQIENIDLKIENLRSTIELYNINIQRINENKKIEEKITMFQDRLKVLSDEKSVINNKINELKNTQINNFNQKILLIQSNIERYLLQERKELVHKMYVDSISRDGIPRLLLLRMKDKINDELSTLLQDVKFSVYFDDDLCLKLSDNIRPDAEINVIESSGKQRTFASFCLKLALRNINNHSINNMLLLDEVTSKLVDNSVTEFFTLLEVAKTKIDKILIIEHAYGEELNVDHKILVVKDENGISSVKY